jgi:hypothetical protein
MPSTFPVSTDFTLGAVAMLGMLGIFKIYQLFQAPPLGTIEKVCSKPIVNMGDDTKVTVWGFDNVGTYPLWKLGISDDSGYVGRVEAYLRLIKQPYDKKETNALTENPRGKVPFANIQGQMVDDSSKIIETIKNTFNVKVDDHLTEEQINTGHLIQQLLQGSLYWVCLHQKFETAFGRQCFRENMARKIPPVIRDLVNAMVFRNMHDEMHGTGIGRMPHSDIVKRGQADVRCLSKILGDDKFFFGGKPTSYDSDVYAWLVMLFFDQAQFHNMWVQDIKEECSNLFDHTERMRSLLYPELSSK